MTATVTPEADRFRREMDVPDPPKSPKGRLRYWSDTVQEAVAELRRQLRSHDPDRADRALFAVIDLEKTRLRHGGKISGTAVSCLPDVDDDWGNPIVTVPERTAVPPAEVAPVAADPGLTAGDEPELIVAGREAGIRDEETSPPGPLSKDGEGVFKATSSRPEPASGRDSNGEAEPRAPVEHPLSGTERGPGGEVFTTSEMPTAPRTFSDRDDDWTRDPARRAAIPDWEPDPWQAAIDRREARLRAAYIEATGRTPEEDFPLEAIGYFSGRPCVVPDHLKHLVPGFRQPTPNPEPPPTPSPPPAGGRTVTDTT